MTFDEWLAQQRGRQDPVGELARDVAADPEWPVDTGDVDRYGYLIDRGATTSMQVALARAHREYFER